MPRACCGTGGSRAKAAAKETKKRVKEAFFRRPPKNGGGSGALVNFTPNELPGAFLRIAQAIASGKITEADADLEYRRLDKIARDFEEKGLGIAWTNPERVYTAGTYRSVATKGMVREHAISQACSAKAVEKLLEDVCRRFQLDLDAKTDKGTPLRKLLKQRIGGEFPVIRMYHGMHVAAETSSSGDIHDIWADALTKGAGEAVVRDALSVLWTTTGGFGGHLLPFVESVASFEVSLNDLKARCICNMGDFLVKYSPNAAANKTDAYVAVESALSTLNIEPLKWEGGGREAHLARVSLQEDISECYTAREELDCGVKSGRLLARIFSMKQQLLEKYISWFESGSALVVPEIIH